MKIVSQSDIKLEALQLSGTLNSRPTQVTSALFQKDPFFDSRDLVQVKYEMLRSVERDGISVACAAAMFGFSRVGWYQIKARYDGAGLVGLLPQLRGPKTVAKKRAGRSAAANYSANS